MAPEHLIPGPLSGPFSLVSTILIRDPEIAGWQTLRRHKERVVIGTDLL